MIMIIDHISMSMSPTQFLKLPLPSYSYLTVVVVSLSHYGNGIGHANCKLHTRHPLELTLTVRVWSLESGLDIDHFLYRIRIVFAICLEMGICENNQLSEYSVVVS